MLGGVQVIEFSHPHTTVGGQILSDLGADVIVVEPVGGSAVRRIEPFENGSATLESSLTWQAFNRGKRSITIDVSDPDGSVIARSLTDGADIVLRSCELGVEETGSAVWCTARPFSASGPKNAYAYTDKVLHVSTASPQFTGEEDRAPITLPVAQPMMEIGGELAIGAVAAFLAKEQTGEGQRVGVSARIAALMSALSLPYWAWSPSAVARFRGTSMTIADVTIPHAYPCKDGYTLVSIPFGGFVGATERLVEFIVERGFGPQSLADIDWAGFLKAYAAGETTNEPLATLVEAARAFAAASTKMEIVDAAQKYRFFAAPLMEMPDVAAFDQFAERGLWSTLTRDDGTQLQIPAQFAQISDYAIPGDRPAPRLSEHTWPVLTDQGLTPEEIQALFAHSII